MLTPPQTASRALEVLNPADLEGLKMTKVLYRITEERVNRAEEL